MRSIKRHPVAANTPHRATLPTEVVVAPHLLLLFACNPTGLKLPSGPNPAESPAPLPAEVPALRLNEVMANNQGTILDPRGGRADWVELYNGTSEAVNLDGWTVAQHWNPAGAHPLDGLALDAGGHLLLWADGEPDLGPDHLAFSLDSDGDALALYAPGGIPADGLTIGRSAADISLVRVAGTPGFWSLSAAPTPGSPNLSTVEFTPTDSDSWPAAGEPCGLVAGLETFWFTEGETVEFSLTCSDTLATEDATLTIVSAPTGAELDGDLKSFRWVTGPSSSGRIDLVFSVTPTGSPTAVPHAETTTFWIADNPDDPANIPVDPLTYTEEWGLPVLFLAPNGELGSEYIDATVTSDGVAYPAQAKLRGASSLYYDKQSYMLEFNADELPVPAWGVTRNHLILLSTFDDNSYVRQKLVYDLWAAIADYWGETRLTPRTQFVVLYLNGAYHGLYVALDRVDDEFLGQMGLESDSDLYKAVNHDANFYLTNSSGGPKSTLHDGYTKEEGDPSRLAELDAFVTFTGNSDAPTLIAGAPAWFDLEEFMDWFLLVHYANSEDSAGKNAYFAKVPYAGLFRYAPWDHNHSWGQGWYTYRIGSEHINDYVWTNRIFWAIQEDAATEAALWERFGAMRADGPFDPEWLQAEVEGYYALIAPSAERDWEKWGDAYRSYGGWASSRDAAGDWTDHEGEKAYLSDWMAERAELFEQLHPR